MKAQMLTTDRSNSAGVPTQKLVILRAFCKYSTTDSNWIKLDWHEILHLVNFLDITNMIPPI